MNGFNVATVYENKRMFPTVKRWTGDGYEESRMMVSKRRKTIRLTDAHGGIVEIASYIHRGVQRYKDSREKRNNGNISESEAKSELKRMLAVSDAFAEELLSC